MKEYFLALLLAAMSSTALAEWEFVDIDSSGDSYLYIDRASIVRNGDMVKVWTLQDHVKPQPSRFEGRTYTSEAIYEMYDCKEHTSANITFMLYEQKLGKGAVVDSLPDELVGTEKMRPYPPGSIGAEFEAIACAKEPARKLLKH